MAVLGCKSLVLVIIIIIINLDFPESHLDTIARIIKLFGHRVSCGGMPLTSGNPNITDSKIDHEYAINGCVDGTSFVDVTDPL